MRAGHSFSLCAAMVCGVLVCVRAGAPSIVSDGDQTITLAAAKVLMDRGKGAPVDLGATITSLLSRMAAVEANNDLVDGLVLVREWTRGAGLMPGWREEACWWERGRL